jgi:NADH:ubiquinone oxidoreductase subunit 5 (subunit L)/multisubunit Na+/H+ antiporter MnhA subunit
VYKRQVKVYGIAFLGEPRSAEHAGGVEAPSSMLVPMALLALVCLSIGVAPLLLELPLSNAIQSYLPGSEPPVGQLVPLGLLSWLGAALLALGLMALLLLARRSRRLPVALSRTWGCGYLRPEPRMQYSAASFGDTLVSWFRMVLRPEVEREEVAGLFPGRARFASRVPETALERVFLPLLEYLYEKSLPVRRLQHGKLNLYIVYTFVTLVVLLVLTTR